MSQRGFFEKEVEAMRQLLADPAVHPALGGRVDRREHVEHCFSQLRRFARGAMENQEFRYTQFGLNLGRVQELLGSYGGVEMWWRTFEPLVEQKKWGAIIATVEEYCALLGVVLDG